MADPVSIVAVSLRTIDLLVGLDFSRVRSTVSTHGWVFAFFTVLPILQISKADSKSAKKLIVEGGDEEALAFRQSVTNECNMTAVAGAIVAQIAITSLSLPNLSQVHWTARASLLFSLVSGLLSVVYACVLRRIIGNLYGPAQIRKWLTVPTQQNQSDSKPQISFAALSMVSAPFKMVEYSVMFLLLALAVYQGLIWTKSLDTVAGTNDSRNVFIAYIVGTGYCLEFFISTFVLKTVETVIYRMISSGRYLLKTNAAGRNHEQSGLELGTISDNDLPRQDRHYAADPYPGHDVDESQTTGLEAALQAAARAHEQCAKADLQVAQEYTKASTNLNARQL